MSSSANKREREAKEPSSNKATKVESDDAPWKLFMCDNWWSLIEVNSEDCDDPHAVETIEKAFDDAVHSIACIITEPDDKSKSRSVTVRFDGTLHGYAKEAIYDALNDYVESDEVFKNLSPALKRLAEKEGYSQEDTIKRMVHDIAEMCKNRVVNKVYGSLQMSRPCN